MARIRDEHRQMGEQLEAALGEVRTIKAEQERVEAESDRRREAMVAASELHLTVQAGAHSDNVAALSQLLLEQRDLVDQLRNESKAALREAEDAAALKLAEAESDVAKLRLAVSELEGQIEEHCDGRIAALEALQGAHEVALRQLVAANREAMSGLQLAHQMQLDEIQKQLDLERHAGQLEADAVQETVGLLRHRVSEADESAAKHHMELSEMWSLHLSKVRMP